MRLTPLGRDLLVAMVLVELLGAVTGAILFEALGAAMGATSMLSLAALGISSTTGVRAESPIKSVRMFKGDTERVSFRLVIPGGWTTAEVISAKLSGADVSVNGAEAGAYVLLVRQPWAGRFKDPILTVKMGDALGLFTLSTVMVPLRLVVEALPISLKERRQYLVSPSVFGGEMPGGAPGKGQEYFSAEEYTLQTEARDIMWKRAAKAPGEPLLARVREVNVPARVGVSVIHGRVSPDSKVRLTDAQCEVFGALGSALLGAGIRPVYQNGEEESELTGDWDLAEAVMDSSEVATEAATPAGGADLRFVILVGEDTQAPNGGPRTRVIAVSSDRMSGPEGIPQGEAIPVLVGRALAP